MSDTRRTKTYYVLTIKDEENLEEYIVSKKEYDKIYIGQDFYQPILEEKWIWEIKTKEQKQNVK